MADSCSHCGAARVYGSPSCAQCGYAYGSQWHDRATGPLTRRQLMIIAATFIALAVAWVIIFGHP